MTGTSELYSRMERALLHLQQRQMEANGVKVVYRRDGVSLPITAAPTTPDADEDPLPAETEIQVESQSWLIWAVDLRIEGDRFEPRRGDEIIRELPDRDRETWAVTPDRGLQEAVFTDATHLMWMVQSKLINRESL